MQINDIERHIADIQNILNENLPEGFTGEVSKFKTLGSVAIKVKLSAGHWEHDGVSLALWYEHRELATQGFGGYGGGSFFRKPDRGNPKEKHLAFGRVKVPFRKPKFEEEKIYAAIGRFAKRYAALVLENLEVLPKDYPHLKNAEL